MARREFHTPAAKREELKTYRELALRRDLKSIRQRKRVEANGLRRVLGNGSDSQPYLIVETQRYLAVRLEVQHELLCQAQKTGLNLAVDVLLGQLKARIESLAYARLAAETAHEVQQHVPVAALGRGLTAGERDRFAASHAMTKSSERAANQQARTALDRVLGSVERRQAHNPVRYQMLWAQVVGEEVAQQSYLDEVNAATQTAYFRCFNSVLSTDLQRRAGLAVKLARALGVPVRQLKARF
jgi:hypothetical protein